MNILCPLIRNLVPMINVWSHYNVIMLARPRKLRNGHFVCKKYRQKLVFTYKIVKTCNFYGIFWLNMLENDDSNLQNKVCKLECIRYHFKYCQNNPILKSRDCAPPPTFQLWKLTLPGKVVGSFFPFKIRGKVELKGARSNLYLLLRVFEHRGENCWGLLQPPSEN